ncbi:transcriptional regulator, RpiR family [Modicisalibacter ilicicola DSM 19980]|uniref:Transcriptional regulator, RpiR family n=1 Tax=Modicisalibacter ilicicola DSM 19980 TaxID=1121942 RepID=A0A1M4UB67_9GAMM|nr:MurR/RpiR family transcriptional regulator [Halomonas ilicicola]SHE53790.1 transcriptional regulator, RpiR family [Halomonas ilicicola DSM 19980]
MNPTSAECPPTTLAELQALAEHSRRGESTAPRLSAKALALLDALLATPETTGLSSISQLGERQGVHPSSLTRLARALGLPGFKAFQALFREGLASSTFYSTRAERLLDFGEVPGTSPSADQDQALWQQEMTNLSATVASLDDDALQQAVEAIVSARRVHVVGLRASFGAAHYLAYYLDYLRDGVQQVSLQAGVGVEQALRLDGDDLVIGIAFRPETRASLDYCRLARERGARLVALTNHPGSQLAGLTECCLIAPAEGPFFFNPMSSLFLLAELLLSRVARELGGTAVASIRQREALIARLGVE